MSTIYRRGMAQFIFQVDLAKQLIQLPLEKTYNADFFFGPDFSHAEFIRSFQRV